MSELETHPTPEAELHAVLTPTDRLSVSSSGDLMIEGCVAPELLARYGSPLYVISEETLRTNFRRIRNAFAGAWPSPVAVLYAIKANNNLAVRAILHQEGAGGDCFGESELEATFRGGANAKTIVLNGSNKSLSLLRRAVELGVLINIDSEDEISGLAELGAELRTSVRTMIRLKLSSPGYAVVTPDYFGGPDLVEYVRRSKWGFSLEAVTRIIRRIRDCERLELQGFHFHIGRASRDLLYFEHWAQAFAETVVAVRRETGFAPGILDIGGGWPRERDPESRSVALNPTPIEEYTKVVTSCLLRGLAEAGPDLPELWLEPGRFIVGNAVVFLATVGAIKRDLGLTWVNLDASTNNLMRIDTSGSAYHLFPASSMNRESTERVTFVGETCIDSIFAVDRLVPPMKRGEAVAVLDAGMYAETGSTQLNGVPRPATVLVSGSRSEIIKERETIFDVFSKHLLPKRLRVAPVNAGGVDLNSGDRGEQKTKGRK